jgi:hypothetical protein
MEGASSLLRRQNGGRIMEPVLQLTPDLKPVHEFECQLAGADAHSSRVGPGHYAEVHRVWGPLLVERGAAGPGFIIEIRDPVNRKYSPYLFKSFERWDAPQFINSFSSFGPAKFRTHAPCLANSFDGPVTLQRVGIASPSLLVMFNRRPGDQVKFGPLGGRDAKIGALLSGYMITGQHNDY